MQSVFSEQDYQAIANEVLKIIQEEYELKPKESRQLIGMQEFRRHYGHCKSPAWLKLYLLPKMPGVFGLNAGRGHPVKIDVRKAAKWLTKHEDEIDWDKPLPR